MKIMYRVEVDYFSRNYKNKCCETSTPFFNEEEAAKAYAEACSTEKCIDRKTKPARVKLTQINFPDDLKGWGKTYELARNF